MVKNKPTKIEFSCTEKNTQLPVKLYKSFVQDILRQENIPINYLNIISVGDEYLRAYHREYLNDDNYTDVMTFTLSENGQQEVEIYISIDRATENAWKYNVSRDTEIARLIIHGLLHVKGYSDTTNKEKQEMHEKENEILSALWKEDL